MAIKARKIIRKAKSIAAAVGGPSSLRGSARASSTSQKKTAAKTRTKPKAVGGWTGSSPTPRSPSREAWKNKQHARRIAPGQRKAALSSAIKGAQSRFRGNNTLAAKSRVRGVKAATRSNFPLARKMKGTKLGSAMRQGAAAEIRSSRRANSSLKGRASGGHVGIAKFHASTGRPFVGSAKGRSARLVRISHHKGITSTKALGRITL